MTSVSTLEAEDLENIPLVRMADVQPDRRLKKVETIVEHDLESGSDSVSQSSQVECLEAFVADGSECYSELQCDDEDSNIGSMVSIKSEEIICDGETELIVPEVLDSVEVPIGTLPALGSPVMKLSPERTILIMQAPPDRWPTLEILPGGVINLAEKTDNHGDSLPDKDTSDVGEMMYACAKCSQSFKYLFCLVKHVRWHEEEANKKKCPETTKLTPIEKKMADLQRRSKEMDKIIKTHKGITVRESSKQKCQPQKETTKEKYICLHSSKRRIIPKPKVRRAPKKS